MKYLFYSIHCLVWWSFTATLLWFAYYHLWDIPVRLQGLSPTFYEFFLFSVMINVCSNHIRVKDFKP